MINTLAEYFFSFLLISSHYYTIIINVVIIISIIIIVISIILIIIIISIVILIIIIISTIIVIIIVISIILTNCARNLVLRVSWLFRSVVPKLPCRLLVLCSWYQLGELMYQLRSWYILDLSRSR